MRIAIDRSEISLVNLECAANVLYFVVSAHPNHYRHEDDEGFMKIYFMPTVE